MQHNHLKKQHLDCQRLPSHTCDAGWRMWMELIQQIRLLSRFETYDSHLGNTFCLEGETMMEHNHELQASNEISRHCGPSATANVSLSSHVSPMPHDFTLHSATTNRALARTDQSHLHLASCHTSVFSLFVCISSITTIPQMNRKRF